MSNSLIWPNWVKIWSEDFIVITRILPWFCVYLYFPNPTQIGQAIKILDCYGQMDGQKMDQHQHKIYDMYVSYTRRPPSLNWMNLLISVVVFAWDTKYKKPEPSDSKKYQHIIVENNNLSPLVPNHSSILAERSLFLKYILKIHMSSCSFMFI